MNAKQFEDKQKSFFYQRVEDCIHWKLSQWSCNQTHNTLNEKLDWLRQVEYSSLNQVLNLKSVKLNWNFFEKVLSRVEKLNLTTQVELRSCYECVGIE